MSDQDKLEDLATKSPEAAAQAREQAKEYGSLFAGYELQLDDGTVIQVPPHPNLRMFDDEAQAAYEQFELELESCDRHPDVYIPEQTVKDSNGGELKLPAETRPGALKVPHRKTGEDGKTTLLDPPYTVRVVQIALGEEEYARLRAGKINGKRGSARDVWRLWNEQGQNLVERQAADSKSASGSVDLAPVPAPDSK